jgi:hypothetical protein
MNFKLISDKRFMGVYWPMIPIEKLIPICSTIYDRPGMLLVGQFFKTYCTETHGYRSFLMMESSSAWRSHR